MTLTVFLISFVALVAAMDRFGMPNEESASGPRSARESPQGMVGAVADRFIARANACDESFRTARVAALQLRHAVAAHGHRLHALLILRRAEAKAQAAREAVIDQHLPEAEALLHQTVSLHERACDELGEEQSNSQAIDRIRRTCRVTAVSLRAHAAFTVRSMDRLLAVSEQRVVGFATAGALGESRREAA